MRIGRVLIVAGLIAMLVPAVVRITKTSSSAGYYGWEASPNNYRIMTDGTNFMIQTRGPISGKWLDGFRVYETEAEANAAMEKTIERNRIEHEKEKLIDGRKWKPVD